MTSPHLFYHCDGRDLPDYSKKAFDSFVVENGRIHETGFALETMSRFRLFEKTDLSGEVLLPSFADAHTHFLQSGFNLMGCRLGEVASLDELFDRLREYDRTCPDEWLMAWNLDETTLKENRLPTVAELDRVVPRKKLWLSRVDLHSAIPNTPAMDWASRQIGSASLDRGRFCKDVYCELAGRVMAELPPAMKRRALETARRACQEKGIGTVHALEGGWGTTDEDVLTVARFLEEPGLHGVVYHQSEDPTLAKSQNWNRLGGCLFVDGSFGSRTAALNEPYTDAPEVRGELYRGPEKLYELVRHSTLNGMQLALHCIGDRAIDILSKVHVEAFREFGSPPLPHRIEHFELPNNDAMRRVREAGILVSVQPAFESLWGGADRMYEKRLGPERVRMTNPFKTLLTYGIPIAGGSDSPVTPMDPFFGISGFVNHPNRTERIDLNAALAAFIVEPHRFAGEHGDRGRLTPGFRADFVTMADDPFLTRSDALHDLKISRLFQDGILVHPSAKKGA